MLQIIYAVLIIIALISVVYSLVIQLPNGKASYDLCVKA